MWAALLNDENEFQTLIKHLSKTLLLDMQQSTTATGAQVAQSAKNSAVPYFAFAPDNQESSKHALLWLQHNLHPNAFISTGLVRSCGSTYLQGPHFVPDQCVRTAGRVDMGGVPILFEEFSFDSITQRKIKSFLSLPKDDKKRIFGPAKDITLPENREWIQKTFHCEGTDPHIGQFVRTVRSLGASSGCFKIFSESSRPLDVLCQSWEIIISQLMK